MANLDRNDTREGKIKFSWQRFREATYIFRYMYPYRWYFIVGMVLLFLSSLVFMVFPYLAGEMTDIATGNAKHDFNLNQIGLALIIILVLQAVFSYFRIWTFTVVSEKGMADVRKALYNKLISLPIHFFEKNRVGELTSRISADVNHLQTVFSITLAEFTRQILILIVGIALLLITTPRLSGIMLAIFPVIVVGAMIFGRFIRRLSKGRQEALADTNVIVEETLQNINTVKAFANEIYEFGRYNQSIRKVVKVALHMANYRALFSAFIIAVLFGAIFFILWFGATMVQQGDMTIGQLVSFIAYTAIIGGAIGGLGNFYTQILTAIGGTEKIREILGEKGEVNMEHTTVPALHVDGLIEFKGVGFSYPSRPDVPVLDGISFTIRPGEKVALVGQSGSGKTTITALILRFFETPTGGLLIDNKNIYDQEITAYRNEIGLVPQEVMLFGGTIRENILYGNPAASERKLIEAASKANCLGFIESFPEGFETIVGDRGIKLSGGQRQRIAIARAILKDPKILILDEATSSLDAESERLVQEALDILMQGRTSIIIAHRLATIVNVDRIYVIEHGKIVEKGTHAELSSKEDGHYSMLARLQFEVS